MFLVKAPAYFSLYKCTEQSYAWSSEQLELMYNQVLPLLACWLLRCLIHICNQFFIVIIKISLSIIILIFLSENTKLLLRKHKVSTFLPELALGYKIYLTFYHNVLTSLLRCNTSSFLTYCCNISITMSSKYKIRIYS